jgi:ribosomal protein L40E
MPDYSHSRYNVHDVAELGRVMTGDAGQTGPCAAAFPAHARCGEPGLLRVIGCIHEHVRQVFICDRCVSRIVAGTTRCRLCGEHPAESHPCPVTIARASYLYRYRDVQEVSSGDRSAPQ